MYEDTIRAYFTTGYVLVQYFLVRIGKISGLYKQLCLF